MSDPHDSSIGHSHSASPDFPGSANMIQHRYPSTGVPPAPSPSTGPDPASDPFPHHLDLLTHAGESITFGSVIEERTVVLVYRADINPERMMAEIVWVEERLKPGIPFVVVAPMAAAAVDTSNIRSDRLRIYRDSSGAAARLLSPSVPRTAHLVEPEDWSANIVKASDPVFAIGREVREADDRGSDHMLDLGDVFR